MVFWFWEHYRVVGLKPQTAEKIIYDEIEKLLYSAL